MLEERNFAENILAGGDDEPANRLLADADVSRLDQLANSSTGEKSIAFRKEALRLAEESTPRDFIGIAARHTELAKQYGKLGNNRQSLRHFDLANAYWSEASSQLDSEKQGDIAFKDAVTRENYQFAIKKYSQAFTDLAPQLHKVCSPKDLLPANPLAARLHQKMAEAYLAEGGIRSLTEFSKAGEEQLKTLHRAAEEYQNANNTFEEYSKNFGQGKALPEQLKVLGSAILVQCKLAEQGTGVHDWPKAVGLFTTLADIYRRVNSSDLPPKHEERAKSDLLIEAGQKIVHDRYFGSKAHKNAALILQGVYALQNSNEKSLDERINTLQSISDVYFRLNRQPLDLSDPSLPQPATLIKKAYSEKALESLNIAIDITEKAYGKNDPRVVATIKKLAHYCELNREYDCAEQLNKRISQGAR